MSNESQNSDPQNNDPAEANTAPAARRRVRTTTSAFGSGKREAHDATGFYARFVAPVVSADETINLNTEVDTIHLGDARHMDRIADNSVALVVTSPPYFAGKQYEESLGVDGVPANYIEYLELLRDVFAECARVLEPGGRIAVNVANLGRRPYRSLSSDVTQILSDLGLLLRGEVVWVKGKSAGGSCAWGSFQRPTNPVLRDVTERVIIAGKGRFDRAVLPKHRAKRNLPSVATITRDEFLDATTDLWEMAPESAKRVNHPAPFPVELPARLIGMFTFEGDVVLDPFMGSGSTAVAAIRAGRRYLGYDTDPAYIQTAQHRIDAALAALDTAAEAAVATRIPPEARRQPAPTEVTGSRLDDARRQGLQAKDFATVALEEAGFRHVTADEKVRNLGFEVPYTAVDAQGGRWAFDLVGGFTINDSGLRKGDALWRTIGRATVFHDAEPHTPFVVLATSVPAAGSKAALPLARVTGPGRPIRAVIDLLDPGVQQRLSEMAAGSRS
jgi:DNA modification methylase